MIFQTAAGKWLAGIFLAYAFTSANVSAALLLQSLPSSVLTGSQADQATELPLQFITLGPATITSATWWGYYGSNHAAISDNFSFGFVIGVVESTQLGSLTKTVDQSFGPDLFKYELDFSTPFIFSGGSMNLSLFNDDDDAEWFWQGSGAAVVDPPRSVTGANGLSFRLEGTFTQNIPEPGSLALVGLALAGLAAISVRRRRVH